jgi:hypothetical protein
MWTADWATSFARDWDLRRWRQLKSLLLTREKNAPLPTIKVHDLAELLQFRMPNFGPGYTSKRRAAAFILAKLAEGRIGGDKKNGVHAGPLVSLPASSGDEKSLMVANAA